MSSSNRRRESPSRGVVGSSSKLRMDRQPIVTRISDPSLTIGRRKEIDNVMKKARANTNDYWDKKLLEVEEKDPNRWRHTGYKKMYIEGESSSESDPYRSRSRNRKSPPMSPVRKRSSPFDVRRRSPPSPVLRRRSPELKRPRSPDMRRRPRSPDMRQYPYKCGNIPKIGILPSESSVRRKSSRSPISVRKHTPSPPPGSRRAFVKARPGILPRSKRPPSPPPKGARTPSNSSVSSCSDDSCSVCSPKLRHARSRSVSPLARHAPLSPSPHAKGNGRLAAPVMPVPNKQRSAYHSSELSGRTVRQTSPTGASRTEEKHRNHSAKNHRVDDKVAHASHHTKQPPVSRERAFSLRNHTNDESPHHDSSSAKHSSSRLGKSSRTQSTEYVRNKNPPEPPELSSTIPKKKSRDKPIEKLRTKVKIEGEKRKHKDKEKEREKDSSDSDESSSSENSFPTFAATTRLTLSERFGKMAQWSVDRSNMENMRITKDSTGGALKVMIEEGLESSPRRYSYSPAPQGHFPEELATTAPTGLMSWDDVRVRYEYYKSRGYLRDLDLKDYVKWEEWWYRYQEWLKQERYYEFYERQQMNRRRRKKVPITQRLN